MKNFLPAIVLLAAVAAPAAAQTVADPYSLLIGENTLSFEGSYSMPYYKYTAPEDQMLIITPQGSASFSVTFDGSYSNKVPTVTADGKTSFLVEGGSSVFVQVTTYASPTVFNVEAKPYAYNLAADCSDPIEFSTGADPLFIPFHEKNYTEQFLYLKYHATETATLEMTFSAYVHDASVAEDCDGSFTGITFKSTSSGSYKGSFPVEEGKDYMVKIRSYRASMLTAGLIHPIYGESEEYPITITDNEASVPAAAGSYYYAVTAPESGYAVISSPVESFAGKLTWRKTADSWSAVTVENTLDMRNRVSKDVHYLIIVEKGATDAEVPINVDFTPVQPFDAFSSAATVPFGEATALPPYEGTYYYRISVPQQGAWNLKVALEKPFESSFSYIRLYTAADESKVIYMGDPDIYGEVASGVDYILKVNIAKEDVRNSFTPTLEELMQGDGASMPFDMAVDENPLPAGPAKYYIYTAEKNSWAVINPADKSINAPVVTGYTGTDYSTVAVGNVTVNPYADGAYRFEVEEGKNYLVKFTKVAADTSFEFSLPDYAQGESKFDPFEISGNEAEIPSEPATYWFRYVPERDGKLTVSTTLTYDVVTSPTRSNAVSLIAPVTGAVSNLGVDYSSNNFTPLTFNVSEGEEWLVKVTLVKEQQGARLNFAIADFEPGENVNNPIPLDVDSDPWTTQFPKYTGRQTGRWYSLSLVPGQLSITTSQSLSFYLYSPDDTENAICYGKYIGGGMQDVTDPSTGETSQMWVNTYGIENQEITEAADYLLFVYYWYTPELDVTFSGSALNLNTGIDETAAADTLAVRLDGRTLYGEAADTDIAVVAISGITAGRIAAGTSAAIVLQPGIYVASDGRNARKLIVR